MIKEHSVTNEAELVDAIAAGNFDPRNPGPVVVEINLWDGRKIVGSYSRQTPDITDSGMVISDDKSLLPLVQRLLNTNKPLVTETGGDDEVCTLRWEFASAQ